MVQVPADPPCHDTISPTNSPQVNTESSHDEHVIIYSKPLSTVYAISSPIEPIVSPSNIRYVHKNSTVVPVSPVPVTTEHATVPISTRPASSCTNVQTNRHPMTHRSKTRNLTALDISVIVSPVLA